MTNQADARKAVSAFCSLLGRYLKAREGWIGDNLYCDPIVLKLSGDKTGAIIMRTHSTIARETPVETFLENLIGQGDVEQPFHSPDELADMLLNRVASHDGRQPEIPMTSVEVARKVVGEVAALFSAFEDRHADWEAEDMSLEIHGDGSGILVLNEKTPKNNTVFDSPDELASLLLS